MRQNRISECDPDVEHRGELLRQVIGVAATTPLFPSGLLRLHMNPDAGVVVPLPEDLGCRGFDVALPRRSDTSIQFSCL